ncbi:MAG: TrbG/VirB9 family P-type conjugative transfer protein [Acetobacteraceae bacterium]
MRGVASPAGPWGIGIVVVMLGIAQPIRAEVVPAPGAVDPRVRTVRFEADQVYELHGAIGVATDIALQPGERLLGFAGGDLGGVTVSVEGSHVFVKPKAARVQTNLTLLTNRRVYRFDYAVHRFQTASDADADGVIYALTFSYPAPVAKATQAARAVPAKGTAARRQPARPINRRYVYAGSRGLKPLRAWDDGVETHLIFGPRQAIPAIFVRYADGGEGLVDFTVVAEGVIVRRVAAHLILRRGRLTGCVWNQAFRGAGARLPTGTVVPGLKRVIKAVRR